MTWLFDLCTDQFEIFSLFLAKAEVISGVYKLEIKKKKTREMDTYGLDG